MTVAPLKQQALGIQLEHLKCCGQWLQTDSNTSAGSEAAFEDKIQVRPSVAIVLLNKDWH